MIARDYCRLLYTCLSSRVSSKVREIVSRTKYRGKGHSMPEEHVQRPMTSSSQDTEGHKSLFQPESVTGSHRSFEQSTDTQRERSGVKRNM